MSEPADPLASHRRNELALLFDIEARYKVESGADFYRVEITLPYMEEQTT